MKRAVLSLMFMLVGNVAPAYKFHLQFPVPPNSRNLTVIGYRFTENTVEGDCSYHMVSACSGRACHPIITYHYNTCTWDLYGNLLSVAAGAPPAQSPLYTSGTEIVYAASGTSTTGRDTGGFGFANSPAAHYAWQTPNGAYDVIPDTPHAVPATLISDGDLALNFGAASVVAQVSGTITPSPGEAYISQNTCIHSLALGLTCTVTVIYNPKTIACTDSPYG